MATGDVIGFMHSDDLFASDTILEKVAEIFKNHDTGSLYGGSSHCLQKWTPIKCFAIGNQVNLQLTAQKGMDASSHLLCKKENLRTSMVFLILISRIAADYDTMLRFLENIASQHITCLKLW